MCSISGFERWQEYRVRHHKAIVDSIMFYQFVHLNALTGAAYHEGQVPILNAYTWCGVDSSLSPEDHSCGSWEFMEWNVQWRFFRAAPRPGDFSAFNPRFSKQRNKERKKKTNLNTLLEIAPYCRPTESPVFWFIPSIAIWITTTHLWRIWSIM